MRFLRENAGFGLICAIAFAADAIMIALGH
jgi:hypothetical protein